MRWVQPWFLRMIACQTASHDSNVSYGLVSGALGGSDRLPNDAERLLTLLPLRPFKSWVGVNSQVPAVGETLRVAIAYSGDVVEVAEVLVYEYIFPPKARLGTDIPHPFRPGVFASSGWLSPCVAVTGVGSPRCACLPLRSRCLPYALRPSRLKPAPVRVRPRVAVARRQPGPARRVAARPPSSPHPQAGSPCAASSASEPCS